jgi:anti-sigma-K factor RskA
MSPADHDADDLVVRAALGEELTGDERRRLEDDPDLQERVAEFEEIVDLARSDPDAVASDATVDHLWSGIAAEAFGAAPPTATRERPTDPDPAAHRVVPLWPRRARWVAMGAVAAAAAAAVAVLVTVGPLGPSSPQPVAAAELEPFGGAQVAAVEGEFVVVDGDAELRLDLSGLPERDDGFYEVWLLDPEEGRLVSLGPARADGTYALPSGTGVDDFPSVDVSVEPHDGDPGHSGASVLRGSVRA